MQQQNFQSFTLFECLRTMPNTKMAGPPEPVTDEYFVLHDNRYIADMVVDFRNKNEKAGKVCTWWREEGRRGLQGRVRCRVGGI